MAAKNTTMDLGLEVRKNVLENALYIEGLTSILLSKLLGIQNAESSKSFGNTSSSLSFNAKINLLIDIGALQAVDRKKFQWFMEVRNQFMHNPQASDYVKCFSFLGDSKKGMLKQYSHSGSLSEDEQLQQAFEALTHDVIKLTSDIIEKVKEHIQKKVETEANQQAFKAMNKAIDVVGDSLDSFIDKEMPDKNFDVRKLKNLGRQVKRSFYSLSKRYLKEMSESKHRKH